MRESFLHYLWRTRRFYTQNLHTTQNQGIEIREPGEQNPHAGPDFFNARLCIGHTHWAGNVEMHISSSEWLTHGHSTDPAYDNVILHVVFIEDTPILRTNGERIPCLELKNRIPPDLLGIYERLEREEAWIPCEQFIQTIPGVIRTNWLDRLMIERLETKTAVIKNALLATQNDWEEAFYRVIAQSFGLKVNTEPFEALARTLPLKLLAKHKSNLLQIEALIFGQAGFLKTPFQDQWPKDLAREYRHLAHKYDLTPLQLSQWKYLRLRPANFPSVRLAQFSALIHRAEHLFANVLEVNSLAEVEQIFQLQTSTYWEDHFLFDKPSIRLEKHLGQTFIHLLIINTIVPVLFYYGKSKDLETYQQHAIALLESIPPERNALLDSWNALGFSAKNAFHSQALIQLKTHYCDQKRCLDCAFGGYLLR